MVNQLNQTWFKSLPGCTAAEAHPARLTLHDTLGRVQVYLLQVYLHLGSTLRPRREVGTPPGGEVHASSRPKGTEWTFLYSGRDFKYLRVVI